MKNLCLIGCLAAALQFAHAQDATPAAATPEASFSGKVLETTNTAGYTYVFVDTGSKKVWAAAVQFDV